MCNIWYKEKLVLLEKKKNIVFSFFFIFEGIHDGVCWWPQPVTGAGKCFKVAPLLGSYSPTLTHPDLIFTPFSEFCKSLVWQVVYKWW